MSGTQKWRISKRNRCIPGFVVMFFAAVGLIGSNDLCAQNANHLKLNELSSEYFLASSNSETIRLRFRSYQLIGQGLKYATSKLCPIDSQKDLASLNNEVFSLLRPIQKKMDSILESRKTIELHGKKAQGLLKSGSQPIDVEIDAAHSELKTVRRLNRATSKLLDQVHAKIMQSEVLYQKVLADCLFGDFMSLFGPEKTPVPIPEIPDDVPDDIPDDLLDFQDFLEQSGEDRIDLNELLFEGNSENEGQFDDGFDS